MISGVVTASRQAVIRLSAYGPGGAAVEVEAVIDTGFNGELTMPSAFVTALDLTWQRRGRALLADGSESLFDSYDATVVWDGTMRQVTVDVAETEPLVGMTLLDGYEVTIQALVGGVVTLTALR
jgi:clan AA aspartic protease